MSIKIERKWKVDKDIIYDIGWFEKFEIIQNYIYVNNEDELRIRKVKYNDNPSMFTLTYKKLLNRYENKYNRLKLSEEFHNGNLANLLIDNIKEKSIIKVRHLNNMLEDKLITIDIFLRPELEYGIAEVEFDSGGQSRSFNTPDFVDEELDISNSDIWKQLNNIDRG